MEGSPIEVSIVLADGKITVTQVFAAVEERFGQDDCLFVALQIAAELHREFPLTYHWFPVKGGYCGKAH